MKTHTNSNTHTHARTHSTTHSHIFDRSMLKRFNQKCFTSICITAYLLCIAQADWKWDDKKLIQFNKIEIQSENHLKIFNHLSASPVQFLSLHIVHTLSVPMIVWRGTVADLTRTVWHLCMRARTCITPTVMIHQWSEHRTDVKLNASHSLYFKIPSFS